MGRDNSKFIVEGKKIPSTQSAFLAPRGTPAKKSSNAAVHSNAFLMDESKIIMKGSVNARDNRYK